MPAQGSNATTELIAKAPLEVAWSIATPLTPVGFYPKFGPLPATIEVRHQTGAWDAPGQTRQLMLSDGGSVIEHTVEVRKCEFFAYELSDFQKLFGKIVEGARAEWTFAAVEGGTRIHWSYTFFAKPGRGLVLAAIIRLWWAPYMRWVLPGIVAEVERNA